MHYRIYSPEKDKDAVHRIWLETGWIEKGKEEIMDVSVAAGSAIVADVDGEPECLVISSPGSVRYLDRDLPLCVITGVTTSRIARKQALAKRLTAQSVANGVADGALVAALSMFEQGYYNQIGFGTGGYERSISFDPAALLINKRARVPKRITIEHAEAFHAARLARKRGHGSCNLFPSNLTRGEMMWRQNGFGLGYFDGPNGEISHAFWAGAKEVEYGPYNIGFMVYQNGEQFLELMALLKNISDQVYLVKMHEPRDIQVQDLISQPFKRREITQNSPYAAVTRSAAYWQMRICDLPACLERTHLPCGSARFNLSLHDPISSALDEHAPWRGVSGDYVVTLGPSSGAEKRTDVSLPTLTASVGAFTRLWLGVLPATGLAITDELSGPAALLEDLDSVLRLPRPTPEWEF